MAPSCLCDLASASPPRSVGTGECALQTMRIGEHHIPAFDVWMAVLRNGGNEAVTDNKLWATIGRSVTNPPQCASSQKTKRLTFYDALAVILPSN